MDTHALVAQIATILRLPDLRLDSRGLGLVHIDGSPSLHLEADAQANCLHVYAIIASAVTLLSHEACLMLLKGNTFGMSTGGASLAFDDPAKEILLCARLEDATVPTVVLQTWLERFVACARHWQAEYESLCRAPLRSEPARPTMSRGPMMLVGRV